jgi:hypothetical protein
MQHNHLNRKNIIQNQKYKCKNNIKVLYLTFILCTNKQITEMIAEPYKRYTRLQLMLQSKREGPTRHRTHVLRRPTVFLRVRCSISVRCSILILLIKTVRCSTRRCMCDPQQKHWDAAHIRCSELSTRSTEIGQLV